MNSQESKIQYYEKRIEALEKENLRLQDLIKSNIPERPTYLQMLVSDPVFEKPITTFEYGKVS